MSSRSAGQISAKCAASAASRDPPGASPSKQRPRRLGQRLQAGSHDQVVAGPGPARRPRRRPRRPREGQPRREARDQPQRRQRAHQSRQQRVRRVEPREQIRPSIQREKRHIHPARPRAWQLRPSGGTRFKEALTLPLRPDRMRLGCGSAAAQAAASRKAGNARSTIASLAVSEMRKSPGRSNSVPGITCTSRAASRAAKASASPPGAAPQR